MEFIQTSITIIPFLPLLGALVLGLFGKKIQKAVGENITGIIGCATPVLAAVLAFSSFFVLLGMEPDQRIVRVTMATWVSVAEFSVDWAFRYDSLTSMMVMIITGIGSLIHIYSMGYMHKDESFWRFFAYINLFSFHVNAGLR